MVKWEWVGKGYIRIIISRQLAYKQSKSGRHSLTLSWVTEPRSLCARFIFKGNLIATAVKKPKAMSCNTNPPITIFCPVLLFLTSSLAPANIAAPALCVRKETTSKPTKILVTHVSETPKAVGFASEEKVRSIRPKSM